MKTERVMGNRMRVREKGEEMCSKKWLKNEKKRESLRRNSKRRIGKI